MTSLIWRGKEIKSPLGRSFAVVVLILGLFVVLPVGILITLPLHPILRLCGRRGFVVRNDDGSINYDVGVAGFRRPNQQTES